jgi:hypothetical protein
MSWKKARQFLPSALVVIVIAEMWITHAINRAFDNMCGNQILSESSSPDRTYRVVVFRRDCGATTGFSTQVSVLKAMQALPNESGNLFIADTDRGEAPIG